MNNITRTTCDKANARTHHTTTSNAPYTQMHTHTSASPSKCLEIEAGQYLAIGIIISHNPRNSPTQCEVVLNSNKHLELDAEAK
uniref:Uncharacterized protein n=1 Tax=Setaria italica TaxID=4555 RepID=K3Z2A5_SETIT